MKNHNSLDSKNFLLSKKISTIYLDHSATSPIDPEVWKAMKTFYKEDFGNASTLYSLGREAKKAIEQARIQVAYLINSKTDEVYFTSGGTESDNLAIIGTANRMQGKGNHIITSSIEHPAVMETCKYLKNNGFEITFLPVDNEGIVKVSDVEAAIKENTILVTIMHANNEIGTIQPIAEIGEIARDKGIIFHTDAVQTVGKIPVDVEELNVDLLSISAHKLYGPKGVGALYIKKGVRLNPIFHGGGHEKGIRPGTENVPGIVGLGKACEIAQKDLDTNISHITQLQKQLIEGILGEIPDVKLNGHPTKRLANNANFSFKNVKGEPLIFLLDSKGLAASTGSACSSKKLDPSHVLRALGLKDEDAQSSLRVTLGKENTREEIEFAIKTIKKSVEQLRKPVIVSGMTEIVPINRYDRDLIPLDEEIVVDEQVKLIINDKFSRSFSISPSDLKEFATGYLLGEGLVSSLKDIKKIKIDGLDIKVGIDLADFDIKDLVVGSDCFGGWRRKIEIIDRVESEYIVSKKDIFKAINQLTSNAHVWKNTGGTHIAGLVYGDKFISREDVSRHVAADKVIGAAALEGVEFRNSFMVYSGRMPADMMIKLARVGIPIIASNAAPTSSGYAVAQRAGITMLGFVRGERFNIYTRPERILE